MTDQRWRVLTTDTTTLGAAITCVDAVTGGPPRGKVSVMWRERDEPFHRTPSGHFVLTDLPAGTTELTVDVRTPDRYLDRELSLDEVGTVGSSLDTDYEAEEVRLYPSPSYVFGRNATLIRGRIQVNGDPVPAADCWINTGDADTTPSFTAAGRSDDRGEYVLPVRGIGATDVTTEYDDGTSLGEQPLVHVDGEQPVVVAEHPETAETVETALVLPEGETVTLDFTL